WCKQSGEMCNVLDQNCCDGYCIVFVCT
uniref:Delta-conotoxin TxVIB n=1 Tax=Conus textile TaxID=6494 RepID=O16B_CONTE|nr:RecName: Full=Delta-conotoxin TxVIB; AltName: Full=TxIB [Conus textile]AAB20784.1 mollusc-specific conotoxin TxIB [Conus textile, ssp. neovicarius, venom, Peptide, 27 aa] [Conus textile]